MEVKDNGKGLKYVEVTPQDRYELGFGDLCDQCNCEVIGRSIYLPVLNMSFCEKCGKKYLENHSLHPEDEKYQDRNLKLYIGDKLS